MGPRLEEEEKKTYLFYYCIFTTISFTFRLALVLLKVLCQQRHSCFSLKEMTAANMAILRPAASEVRAMLQKIKMDNMEKGASRRLAATAGILNSCQSANPTASSSMASTASAELLFRHQPTFYNASTSFEKWVFQIINLDLRFCVFVVFRCEKGLSLRIPNSCYHLNVLK